MTLYCESCNTAEATTVVNLRTSPRTGAVIIDRRGPWGNPFRPPKDPSYRDYQVVVRQFENWVRTSPDPKAQWIRDHVHELRGKRLACWCAPLPCHGDVLAALADGPQVEE